MAPLPAGVRSVDQAAVVVRDLYRATERYRSQLGIGSWDAYTYGPHRLSRMTFRRHDQPYAMKLGLAFVGPTMHELIEPVGGPSIYEELLRQRGEGLHHLGYYVDDIDRAIAAREGRGYLQSGRGFGADGAYAYFDTERDLGCILEASELPRQTPPPERVYPPVPAPLVSARR